MARCLMGSIVLAIFVSTQYAVIARPPLRIINGTNAEEGEFPYMVQLLDEDGQFMCGGAILAPEWILTAAHCTDFIYSVVYGTNKLYGEQNTTISVKERIQHPNFTYLYDVVPIYDVAVLKLAEPIPFDEKVQPIHLAEANADVPFHVQGVLSGWGMLGSEPIPAEYLQKVNLTLLTDEECKNRLGIYKDLFVPIHHLCDNDNNNGVNRGDSGSPYVINGTQYGITSWVIEAGVSPGAYSRITNPEYRDWIKNITNI